MCCRASRAAIPPPAMSPKRWPRQSRKAATKPRSGSRRFWKSAGLKWRVPDMSRAPAKTLPLQDRPPLRPVKLGPADVTVERRSDGAILMRSPHSLPPHPQKLTERLAHWAKAAPERVFLAQRDAAGGWRTLTYADTLTAVRAIAAA